MAYFPFFMDIEGQKCLIVGGGSVACRKVQALLPYGPDIDVVAPRMAEAMEQSGKAANGKIRLIRRRFEEGDLAGAAFVVAATGDEELNHRISKLCMERRLPVNVVDVKEACSFIFPALIRDGDITVGISTGGSSPTIAQYLKSKFCAAVPKGFGALASQLGGYRELVKERVESLSLRTEIFKEMVTEGVRQGGTLTKEQAELLIDRKRKEAKEDYESDHSDRNQKERTGAGADGDRGRGVKKGGAGT